MSSTAFGTDKSSVMINDDTFLMSIDGMKDLLSFIFLDVFVESAAFTAAASVFYSDLFIDDSFVFKCVDEFKFIFTILITIFIR